MSFNWELFGTPNYDVVEIVGINPDVGPISSAVSYGGIYRTPQVSGATPLRVKAGGDAEDSSTGSGAREVILYGINETGDSITETLATNGSLASNPTISNFLRLHHVEVHKSGTYANASTGSHADDIVIEDSAGTEDWAIISADVFPNGESEIGGRTIPNGRVGYITNILVSTDTINVKATDIRLFVRENILETTPPYSPFSSKERIVQSGGSVFNVSPQASFGPFFKNTDILFMASIDSGSSVIKISCELIMRYENE